MDDRMNDTVPSAPPLWWLSLPAVTDPEGDVARDFETTRRQAGYVSNVMLTLANATEPFLSMRALYRSVMTNAENLLSRVECELIALVVSVENRCDLCVIGHSSVLRELTGDPYNVGIIEVNFRRAELSARERALADFALRMTRVPAEMEPACLKPMRQAGLSEQAILQAAHVAAYYNMSNRLMSALGIKSQPQAWFAHRQPPANDRAPP